MKLERLNEEVAPLPHFIFRVGQYALFSMTLILISVGIGLAGYRYYADLRWIDSFHMACMILTGMGPVVEMKTDVAKFFSSLYALYSGVAFLSIVGVFLTPIVHRILHVLHIEKDGN
jgi:type II secretory pathway component PulF